MKETNKYTLDDQDIENLKAGKQFTFSISAAQAIIVDYEPTQPAFELSKPQQPVIEDKSNAGARPVVDGSIPIGYKEMQLYNLLLEKGPTPQLTLRHEFSTRVYNNIVSLAKKGLLRKGSDGVVEALPGKVHLDDRRKRTGPTPGKGRPTTIMQAVETPEASSAEGTLTPTEQRVLNVVRKKGSITSRQVLAAAGINYYGPITRLLRLGLLTREGSRTNPLQLANGLQR